MIVGFQIVKLISCSQPQKASSFIVSTELGIIKFPVNLAHSPKAPCSIVSTKSPIFNLVIQEPKKANWDIEVPVLISNFPKANEPATLDASSFNLKEPPSFCTTTLACPTLSANP
jgi:hypothetical protein